MSEFLTIQVGQCGNQIGGSFWPSILSEYNIDLNKNLHYKETDTSFSSFFDISKSRNEVQTPFSNLSDLISNNVKARVMCIDAENSVVSRFSNSELKHLFDVKSFITSYSGSGNNWAEGYYTHGRKFKNKILKNITRFAERCDSLHGFLLLYSCGGGTGSGLGSYILELLEDNFSNIERFVACVYPTGSEDIITAPFNMMLATQHLMQHATCVFPVENRALQDISDKKKVASTNRFKKLTSIFGDMNSIVVDLLLHITRTTKF